MKLDRLSRILVWILFSLVFSASALSEEIRDYYAEPGLNPFKDTVRDLNESIDPFSGTLQHKYVDMMIPGNGGLDIIINRFYTNVQDNSAFSYRSFTGMGWTMHMGRIVVPTTHYTKICTQALWSVSTKDNPSIEFPDGGRELLVLKDINVDETLITKTNWKADCQGVSQGMRVTSPDGKIYYMDVEEYSQNNYSWYASRIEDLDGNWININYGTSSSGIKYIDSITASDGRSVNFTYVDKDSNAIRLKTISSNSQTVQYDYVTVSGLAGGFQHLTKVTRPDNLTWEYTYYPAQGIGQGGSYSMKSVKYPHGGMINYTYQLVQFELGNTYETTSISTKTTSGPGVTSGTWTYSFTPSTGMGVNDYTTVTTPDGTTTYAHQGYTTGGSLAWPIGLLWQKIVYNKGGNPVEAITNQWGARVISIENYWHGRDVVDNETSVPVLESSQHWKEGFGLTTSYSEHDYYGNPGRVDEECNLVDCDARVTHITYKNDTSRWVIGLPISEVIDGIGTTTKDYYTDGRIKEVNEYGVITTYEYTPQGDLSKETNAKNIPRILSDYYRGIAQKEVMQVSTTKTITIKRTVNPTGTIASKTDGKGITTSFTYDGMNRLATIDFPIKDDVAISYSYGAEELSRGDYRQAKNLNGFGNPVSMIRKDLAKGITVTTNSEYDESGRITFQSYPNSILGVSTEYDVLGRPTKITQGNGAYRILEYGGFLDNDGMYLGDTKITDERGNNSYQLDVYYGNYNKSLGATNRITDETYTYTKRDALGAVTEITQGKLDAGMITNAVSRSYTYDSRRYLETITNPETGLTLYVKDDLGNMLSSTVGSSPTTQYVYDDINRLTYIDYPGATEDVTFVYDDNSNLKQSQRGVFTWDYDYDFNDNMTQEKLTIGGSVPRSFILGYGYDNLDAVSQITYPNGLSVDYLPDALGRATKAGTFANSITHHPNGVIAEIAYGNGIITTYALNNVQFIENIRSVMSTEGDIIDLLFGYDPTGNVETVTDNIVPANNLTLGYDANNRLASADGSWGHGTITYSPHGDILTKNVGTRQISYSYDSARQLVYTKDTSNPSFPYISTYSYDPYGNLSSRADVTVDKDNYILASSNATYTYDDSSNMLATERDTTTLSTRTYKYDANNYRVIADGENIKKISVYNKAGTLLYEADSKKCEDIAYVYVGSNLIAKDIKPSTYDGDNDGTVDCLASGNATPVVTPPEDITVEATALQTPVSLGTATAVDAEDGALTPIPDQTGPFGIGVHTITWSATDSADNTGTATQTVTVQDTTRPVLTVPADVNVVAAVPAMVSLGNATATDIFSVTVSNNAPASYPDGVTVVTWTATDANGNVATGTQKITVQADDDIDGVPNSADNCTQVANPDQRDTNGDGYGNICDADLDGNGLVSGVDLAMFKSVFGRTGPGLDADFNGDEVVDMSDLNIFKTLFAKPVGPSGVAP